MRFGTFTAALGATAIIPRRRRLPAAVQAAETRGVCPARRHSQRQPCTSPTGAPVRPRAGLRVSTVDGRPVQPGGCPARLGCLVIPGVNRHARDQRGGRARPAPASPARVPRWTRRAWFSRVDPQTWDDRSRGRPACLQADGGPPRSWQFGARAATLKAGDLRVFVRGAEPVDFRPRRRAGPWATRRLFSEDDKKLDDKKRRTIGQIIDDAYHRGRDQGQAHRRQSCRNLTKIDVKSDAGTVTLSGTVDSAERPRHAPRQIAASVNGR